MFCFVFLGGGGWRFGEVWVGLGWFGLTSMMVVMNWVFGCMVFWAWDCELLLGATDVGLFLMAWDGREKLGRCVLIVFIITVLWRG